MKALTLTAAALALTASLAAVAPSSAEAAVRQYRHSAGGLTPHERMVIARSAFRLAALKRHIYADGRVTRFERIRLRIAEARHRALVRKERWD